MVLTKHIVKNELCALVVELVDTRDLKSLGVRAVPVQVRPGAPSHATLAQLVERNLAKVEVTSSNLVCRSKIRKPSILMLGFFVSFPRKVADSRNSHIFHVPTVLSVPIVQCYSRFNLFVFSACYVYLSCVTITLYRLRLQVLPPLAKYNCVRDQ